MLNGKLLPNWAKLIVVGIILASIYYGQKIATEKLIIGISYSQSKSTDALITAMTHNAYVDSTRAEFLQYQIDRIREDTNEIKKKVEVIKQNTQ